MESHGFMNAININENINAIVIRGISDLVDGKAQSD